MVCTACYNTGATIINALIISGKNNGHAVFYQAVQTRHALKRIPLFSFLNIFDSNMQNVTKNDV